MSLSLSVLDHLRKEVYTRMEKLKGDKALSKYVELFSALIMHKIESMVVFRQGNLEVDPYSSYIEWNDVTPKVSIRLPLQNKDWNYVAEMRKTWEEAFGEDLSIAYEVESGGKKFTHVPDLAVGLEKRNGTPIYLWFDVPREKVKSVEENAKRLGFNVAETVKILPHTIFKPEKVDWKMLEELLENFGERDKVSFETSEVD